MMTKFYSIKKTSFWQENAKLVQTKNIQSSQWRNVFLGEKAKNN